MYMYITQLNSEHGGQMMGSENEGLVGDLTVEYLADFLFKFILFFVNNTNTINFEILTFSIVLLCFYYFFE